MQKIFTASSVAVLAMTAASAEILDRIFYRSRYEDKNLHSRGQKAEV
jgi:hypothetical protein